MDSHEPPKSIPVIYENTPGYILEG